MTNPPSVSRGLCGGVLLKSRASCLSLSVFIGLNCLVSERPIFPSLHCFLHRGSAEPVREARRAKAGIRARDEALIVHFDAKVARLVLRDHLPRVARGA